MKSRAVAARVAGVLVQDDAYQRAWNGEIVNYWKRLGAQDAVGGKDFAMRRAEAQRSGLTVFESEYRQSWEGRLAAWWTEAGTQVGYGKAFQLDQRIAEAPRNGVFVIAATRDLYTAAWDAQNARYCNVDNAFALGRRNGAMAVEVCQGPQQGRLKRAYLSGRDYELTAARHAKAAAELDEAEHRLDETRHTLNRLEREIRASLESKERVVNDETLKQDKRREQERRELAEHLARAERQRDEARRWEERYSAQMQRLQRDIYVN